MSKVFANIISVILHPLLMPTFGLLLILSSGSNIFILPYEARRIILMIVAINTLALPLLLIPLFFKLDIIKSVRMHEHRERIIPLAFTLVPYLFSYYFLNRLPIMGEIPNFLMGASIAIGIALIVSIWWKISIHMIGIGGIAGLLFALTQSFFYDIFWYLIIAIILAGLVAWARLEVNAHKPAQVYGGFLLGWVTISLSIFLL